MARMIAGMWTCLLLNSAVLGESYLGCPSNRTRCNGNSDNCDQYIQHPSSAKPPAPTTSQPTVAKHEIIQPNIVQQTNSDSGNKHIGESDSTAIIPGAIGGGCVVVVVVFILVLVVYICRRKLSPQPNNCIQESPEVSIPSVLYVNTSNPDIFNEPVGEPTTYESLSRRDADNDNYSSLNKAFCVDD